MASVITDLDHLCIEQMARRYQPGLRLAAHCPTTLATLHSPNDLEQCRRIGFPPIREKERELPGARDDLRDQRGRCALGPRAKVDPEEKPAPHRQRCMDPFDLFGTEFGRRLIPLHTRHLHVLYALPMMGLGTMRGHALEAMDRLDLHITNICSAFVADTPPLTLHQPYDRVFRELAASHQGPLPFGELSVAYRAAQPFDVLVRPGPRPMRDVACAGTVELCTLWIGARESDISLLRWRRQCHNSPPVARNGLKDTGATPVSPRYYSPGLPATVVPGVNKNITTESVVTARTKVVTIPTSSALCNIGNKISRKLRKLLAPRLIAASSMERSICCKPTTAAW